MTEPVLKERVAWWQPLWRLLKKILIVYIVVIILLATLQRKLLYHPSTAPTLPVADFPIVTELFPESKDIELTCEDGITIRGWLLQNDAAATTDDSKRPRPLVIYFHGNAGDRSSRTSWYQLFAELNVDVLAIDYHGYGDSGGSISETGLELDCVAAWKFATEELNTDPQDIVIVGTSLGGAAAIYLAAKQSEAGTPPAALATVATFSSMVDAGRSHYPWLPVRYVLVDRYPSDQRIGKVTCPLLLLHGDNDRIVRYRFGQKLFDAAPDKSANGTPKRWVNLPGVGHNSILHQAGDTLQAELSQLLNAMRK